MIHPLLAAAAALLPATAPFTAQQPHTGGEVNLVLPDLSSVSFLGMDGHSLLLSGLVVCLLGLVFGLVIYGQLRNMAVHASMRVLPHTQAKANHRSGPTACQDQPMAISSAARVADSRH